jgi:hypothetical protein
MSIEFVESKPFEPSIVSPSSAPMPTKKDRYPRIPLKLAEHSQALRGRQMTIAYKVNGTTYGKTIPCPLAMEDTLNVGIEKIRLALLTHKLSLSSVVNVTVNHSIGHETCKAIVRRAIASRS